MIQSRKKPVPKFLLDLSLELGEGLHWDSEKQLLWFVDITGKTLFSFCLEKEDINSYRMPDLISWVLRINNNESLLIGLKQKICTFNPVTKEIHTYHEFKFKNKNIRLNDAKIDHLGQVWMGTMNYKVPRKNDGEFFLLSNNGIRKISDEYNITNGPAISPCNKFLLHNDSLKKITYKYAIDKPDNFKKIGIWNEYGESNGEPDGMCFDIDGNVWIAFWGEGSVKKFGPCGKMLEDIAFPVPYITNVCFAGAQLDRLVVTTAKNGDKMHLSGGLFEILEHQTKGIPTQQVIIE